MQITYNILNLPQKVSQNGATKATYTWFADRNKYSAQDNSGNGYHYIGSLIYSNLSFSGAVIGGGIAILQGESPKRILSATIVGAGQGLFVASGGFLIGMAVGAIGELGEQTLNVKVFEEQSSYDFQAIAISAILGGGSSKFQKLFGGKIDQLATYIDSKYADDAIKKAIRDEILKEKKAYFEPLGKTQNRV